MQKKFKMLIELVAQTETEHWAISVTDSVKLMRGVGAVAKKHKFDCYAKWYPKEVIDYIPTGNTYEIVTVEDIAKLTADQFEMFVEDLRGWCRLHREIQPLVDIGMAKTFNAMNWLDTGLHEEKIKVEISISNKV
jgi:hypothetical protein